jgi:hypothetical protein
MRARNEGQQSEIIIYIERERYNLVKREEIGFYEREKLEN